MVNSLSDYYDLVIWINFSVYLSYLLFKYVVAPILWAVLDLADKGETPPCLGLLGGRKVPPWFCIMAKFILSFMRRLVLLIFGKQLVIVNWQDEGDIQIESCTTCCCIDSSRCTDSNNDSNPTTIHRHERRLSHRVTVVLFIIVVTFGILAVGSALDLTLLFVTHICTEDPNTDCYPQLIRGANGTGLNINIDEPIQDCTFWNSEGVSNRVTFVCYQFVFNVQLFLTVLGGLTAFFVVTIKTTTECLLCLSKCCNRKGKCDKQCDCQCCKCYCACSQAVIAPAAAVIEVVVAAVCFFFRSDQLGGGRHSRPAPTDVCRHARVRHTHHLWHSGHAFVASVV